MLTTPDSSSASGSVHVIGTPPDPSSIVLVMLLGQNCIVGERVSTEKKGGTTVNLLQDSVEKPSLG